jgi:hypothetical protein
MVSSFSIRVLLVHAFSLPDSLFYEGRSQRSGGAHRVVALESFVLVVRETARQVDLPTKRIDGQEQTALAFLIMGARCVDAEKVFQ